MLLAVVCINKFSNNEIDVEERNYLISCNCILNIAFTTKNEGEVIEER
jgi:hypothetical protein